MTHEWTDLARRVLHPGRPRLPEARTVVLGMSDVREAWAALAARELVPGPEVTTGGAFRALASTVDGPRWEPFADDRAAPNDPPLPASVDAAVTLACDPRGLAQAGALALDLAARSAPWEPASAPLVTVTRVAWRVVAPDRWTQRPADRRRMTALLRELMRALGAVTTADFLSVREVRAVLDVTGPGYAQRVADDVAACVLWREAVARDLARPDGARYADLPDPTAAAIALWSTGYALDRLHGDTAVLVAPAL